MTGVRFVCGRSPPPICFCEVLGHYFSLEVALCVGMYMEVRERMDLKRVMRLFPSPAANATFLNIQFLACPFWSFLTVVKLGTVVLKMDSHTKG